jgi:hypothetical protein
MAKKRDNRTTTALYNLAKKKELAKKTGSAKVAADKAAREAPIKEMNRRSSQIKADIKKRTTAAKTRSLSQKAAIAIKYKKK